MDVGQIVIGTMLAIIAFFLKRLTAQFDEMAKDFAGLRLELARDYLKREEWELRWQEIRQRFHTIENWRASQIGKQWLKEERNIDID